MSIENHPNIHVINLMFRIGHAVKESLRGEGKKLSDDKILFISKVAAESIEELVNDMVSGKK